METHKRGRRQFGSLLSPVVSIVHNNVFWFSSFQENVCLYSRIVLPDTLQNQKVNMLKMDIVGGLKAPASDWDSNQGFQFIQSTWSFFLGSTWSDDQGMKTCPEFEGKQISCGYLSSGSFCEHLITFLFSKYQLLLYAWLVNWVVDSCVIKNTHKSHRWLYVGHCIG